MSEFTVHFTTMVHHLEGFPGGTVVKNPSANAADIGNAASVPRSGGSPGGGHDNPTSVFLSGKSYGQRSLAAYGT